MRLLYQDLGMDQGLAACGGPETFFLFISVTATSGSLSGYGPACSDAGSGVSSRFKILIRNHVRESAESGRENYVVGRFAFVIQSGNRKFLSQPIVLFKNLSLFSSNSFMKRFPLHGHVKVI